MSRLTLVALAMALAGSGALTPTAHAQSSAEQRAAARENAKARWDSMTPEEKAAAREKAKAKWDSMTPEEQAAAKKRFAERQRAASASAPK